MGGLMDVMGIAASGLAAATTQVSVAADNIANSQTPGFQAGRVDLVSLSGSFGGAGVAVAGVSRDTSPGPLDAQGKPASNVDLETESVNLIRARVLYSANAMVLKTADQMMGTLLNVLDGRKTH